MPPVVTDPNSLTKEQLKRELSEIGVDTPSLGKTKKSEFVKLYRQHVVKSSSGQLELISDEEEEVSGYVNLKKKSSSPRKSAFTNESYNTEEMDVSSLSDEELRKELELHNVECGPILASTRRVYEKKLLRVLSGDVSVEPVQSLDELDYSDGYDEEPDVGEPRYIEPVVIKPRYAEPVIQESKFTERTDIRQRFGQDSEPSWKSASQKLSRDELHTSEFSRASRYTSYTTTSKTGARSQEYLTQAQPVAEKQKKKGLSIWIQLIIVIIIALIIFMVFQNMEPANKLPTRGIDQSN